MSVDRLCKFYGFTRVPFGRDLAPGSLFCSGVAPRRSPVSVGVSANEDWGTLTGEVGCGKTVAARATVASLEPSRTQVIYCANPTVGGRGILSWSSPPWVAHPGSIVLRWSLKPLTLWPVLRANGDGGCFCSSTKAISSMSTSSRI